MNTHSTVAQALQKYRVGEKVQMHNGLVAEIIEYNSANDVKIRFENGIETNCYYSAFKKGSVRLPEQRIGQKKVMKNGKELTIVEFRNALSIDLEDENGNKYLNRQYDAFKRGSISKPTVIDED